MLKSLQTDVAYTILTTTYLRVCICKMPACARVDASNTTNIASNRYNQKFNGLHYDKQSRRIFSNIVSNSNHTPFNRVIFDTNLRTSSMTKIQYRPKRAHTTTTGKSFFPLILCLVLTNCRNNLLWFIYCIFFILVIGCMYFLLFLFLSTFICIILTGHLFFMIQNANTIIALKV